MASIHPDSSLTDRRAGGGYPVLVAIWAALIGAAMVQNLLVTNDQNRIWLLDVDVERSLYTWFSQGLLIGAAVLLGNIGLAYRDGRRDLALPFLVLSALVFAMSADEALSLHEMLSEHLRAALNADGWLTFVWVLPAAALCLLLLIAFLPFLRHLEARTRNLLLLAAAVFVGGALGTELIGGKLMADAGGATTGLAYRVTAVIEEGLEGLGVLILIAALLDYRRRHGIVL